MVPDPLLEGEHARGYEEHSAAYQAGAVRLHASDSNTDSPPQTPDWDGFARRTCGKPLRRPNEY